MRVHNNRTVEINHPLAEAGFYPSEIDKLMPRINDLCAIKGFHPIKAMRFVGALIEKHRYYNLHELDIELTSTEMEELKAASPNDQFHRILKILDDNFAGAHEMKIQNDIERKIEAEDLPEVVL